MPSLADIVETSRYLGRLLAAKPALAAEVGAALEQAVTQEDLAAWLAAQPIGDANLKPVILSDGYLDPVMFKKL